MILYVAGIVPRVLVFYEGEGRGGFKDGFKLRCRILDALSIDILYRTLGLPIVRYLFLLWVAKQKKTK